MKKPVAWFQNQSLRFQMVALLFLMVFVLQIINGLIFTSMVSDKFEENISRANLTTVEQMTVNLNQVMKNIVSEMVPVREALYSNQFSGDGGENFSTWALQNIRYQEFFNRLLAAEGNYQFIHSMLIVDKRGGRDYVYVKDQYPVSSQPEIFQKLLKNQDFSESCCFSGVVKADYFFHQREEELFSILMPVYRYREVEQILIVNVEAEVVREYLKSLGGSDSLLLQLNNKDVFYSNAKQAEVFQGEEYEPLLDFDNREPMRTVCGYAVMSSRLPINGWKLSMTVPLSSIRSNAGVLTRYIILITFTTGIILFLGVSYIVKKLMDEIAQLMADIKREQVQSRKTYQRMLQMQIKPHFLYNTLEAARFLVEMGDKNGAGMLSTIGQFYRLSLTGMEDIIPLEQEIEHLKCYLQLLKLRYSSKYDYAVQMEEELSDREAIRFSLQPLVENAIYHGIKQKRAKGFVKVLGYRWEGGICLVIWDNGAGIPSDKLKELQEQLKDTKEKQISEHIGVLNVHQRIRMQYGGDYGLCLESQEGEYTRVEMRLPDRAYVKTEAKDTEAAEF